MKNTEQKPPSDFEVMADFNRLYSAYLEARNGKRWKYAVVRFEVNLLENLMALHFLLTSRKYRPSPYNYFLVHEPKERLIMYNGFRDKIIQHSLCDNVLEPRLAKTFILDNYASQKGKGTHFGLDRLKAFMQRYYRQFGADGWVLKCDIRKYFYSINHDVLKSQLRRIIDDPGVLWLLDLIIDSTEGPGIPIGNHTSQWFAVLYLSGLDHMIKERLGIKFYGRYMDDFFLIHPEQGLSDLLSGRNQKVPGPAGPGIESQNGRVPADPGDRLPGLPDVHDGQRESRPQDTPRQQESDQAEVEEVPSPSGRRADRLRNRGPVIFFLDRPR